MRWTALGVDYEMAGKDLIDSVTLSSRICKALGGTPPEGFNYELFLDDKGEKISKSKGNGLTIEEWLTYASPESLSLYMFQRPKSAKKLYFDVIPRAVDEYLQLLAAYPRQDAKGRLDNAVWHIHTGHAAGRRAADHVRPAAQPGGRLQRARQGRAVGLHPPPRAGRGPETHPLLDQLAGYAVRYYEDFVKPQKKFRLPDEAEADALRALSAALGKAGAYGYGRGTAGHHLRCRPHHPALSGPQRQGRHAGQAGRIQCVVRHDLPGAAGRGARAALRQLHRAVRHRQHAQTDRAGGGGRAGGQGGVARAETEPDPVGADTFATVFIHHRGEMRGSSYPRHWAWPHTGAVACLRRGVWIQLRNTAGDRRLEGWSHVGGPSPGGSVRPLAGKRHHVDMSPAAAMRSHAVACSPDFRTGARQPSTDRDTNRRNAGAGRRHGTARSQGARKALGRLARPPGRWGNAALGSPRTAPASRRFICADTRGTRASGRHGACACGWPAQNSAPGRHAGSMPSGMTARRARLRALKWVCCVQCNWCQHGGVRPSVSGTLARNLADAYCAVRSLGWAPPLAALEVCSCFSRSRMRASAWR